MSKEKLLYLLDINGNMDLNKNNAKALLWTDISFLGFIVAVGALFKCISNSIFDIVAICLFVFTTILLWRRHKTSNNLTLNVICIPLILLKSTLQLFYGYWIFANGEARDYGYSVFSWMHAMIAIVFFIVVTYIVLLYVKLYKDVKKMSVEELGEREKKAKIRANEILKDHPWITILPVLIPTPYIASKIFKIWTVGMGLGVGLGMWMLACCWVFLTSLFFPKFVIYMKHKSVL